MGKHYVVSYEIDIFPEEAAETPLQAARIAYDYMQYPEGMLPILRVRDVEGGVSMEIDLHEEGLA